MNFIITYLRPFVRNFRIKQENNYFQFIFRKKDRGFPPILFSYHIFPLQQDTSLLGIEHVENTHFIARIRIHIDEIGVALIIAYKFVSGRFLALYGDTVRREASTLRFLFSLACARREKFSCSPQLWCDDFSKMPRRRSRRPYPWFRKPSLSPYRDNTPRRPVRKQN